MGSQKHVEYEDSNEKETEGEGRKEHWSWVEYRA